MPEASVNRCRIHFEQNSKGAVQRDVTGEAETSAEAAKLMNEGLVELELAIARRGLKTTDKA
jgi:hypothetical protein